MVVPPIVLARALGRAPDPGRARPSGAPNDEDARRSVLADPVGGVPEQARPFGGLVYRQALEHLHCVRDEAATRALISQENRRYARRQLIWCRKEPNLTWLQSSGEEPGTIAAVESILATCPNPSPESS